MKKWMRYLCPSYIGLGYGNWTGAKRTHKNWDDAEPIDQGDAESRLHDFRLDEASQLPEPERSEEIAFADGELYKGWKKFKPPTLYGKIYRQGLLLVFKPRNKEE